MLFESKNIKLYTGYIVWGILGVILYSCAKEAAPAGGPKDHTPPKVLEERPPNESTNFEEKKIKVYFDEFVKLNNLREELLISPPFEQIPKIIVKGKRLIIHTPDSLPENKTVNFNFYDAVVDVNENNVLKNYQYIFSTGSKIDTSFIDGRITNAQTGLPEKNQMVYLYESFEDSVVSKKIPAYVARTNDDGIFVLNYIGTGPYKIFALEDRNRNSLYDQPTERVAFLTDTIIPKIEWTTIFDTVKVVDSVTYQPLDTVYKDSLVEKKVQVSSLKPFQLRMFVKDYERHYMTTSERLRKGLITLGFNRPLEDFKYNFNIIKPKPANKNWYIEQKIGKDSVLLWITDTLISNSDSIYARVTYPFNDSAGNVIPKTDSIYFNYDLEKLSQKDTVISFKNSLRKQKLDIDSAFVLYFSEPIAEFDTTKIQLQINIDTAYKPYPYSTTLEEKNTKLKIHFKQDLLAKYRLIMDSLAVKSIFGNINDSIGLGFQYFEKEEYGNLIFKLDTVPPNAILQLLTEKGDLFIQKQYPKEKNVNFNQLPPGNYKLKVLIDRNRNGEWDTGNYYEKEFPELVIAFTGKLLVKANWDTEQNWELSKELKLFNR